ncbi:MAG: NACHT domain-containing protein [Acidobacteria bacterium]|nr:NACHT domain-containing protein [Acidobacteriota bacterium]
MQPRILHEYHIFLASPGDMEAERREVRRFFEDYNRHTASRWNVRFTVVDWENYSSVGVGRPQELITEQTLERFKDTLALVVGLMGQRFGSPSGTHESGTEEEFYRALESKLRTGHPEIKWFFRNIETFRAPSDPEKIEEALSQWKKVRAFRNRLEESEPRVHYGTFSDTAHFRDVLRDDLSLWLNADGRPWHAQREGGAALAAPEVAGLPETYYTTLVNDFESLDIAGIDNDRAVEIPLSEVYVRLRVIRDEDSAGDEEIEGGPIDIHTALGQYERLVIVGDPGSGKSTFLKFIALTIARSKVEDDPAPALAKLNIQAPLPVPFFISLWDLSDFIKQSKDSGDGAVSNFIVSRLAERGVTLARGELEAMLEAGGCCLLFDGLDEVPTERGRALISRLVEKFVGRYGNNRFVVTSRVRGYTGDTILRGGFVRCDVQDFNESDRREFLLNWFAVLLGVGREHVLDEGTPSRLAFDALQPAIESKDRIRALAVNPLMMTVIAIVHWNRKRLPDQRVDLYDECVDVLLGQRKEAERTVRGASAAEALSEEAERETQYDRAWKRKRFAEIALLILKSGTDEITREVVLGHLRERFRDRPGSNDERAALDAERFLDLEELRSGLLVSRRSHSCRFVHLTFQEYLAAWHLASLSLDDIKATVTPHLRDPQWFETLQLLGGEIARNSDAKLDAYISHLLDHMGTTITRQAPIIALCANVLRDVKGVADIKTNTQERFNEALKGTLHAFRPDSRVPAKTQLEVLRALAPLGARVKEHLIEATKSAHFLVRSESLNMLIPHLPDDDLFSMTHIFSDRSQEPIIVYLSALFERDATRAKSLIPVGKLNYKTAKASLLVFFTRPSDFELDYLKRLSKVLFANYTWYTLEINGALEYLRKRGVVETKAKTLLTHWLSKYKAQIYNWDFIGGASKQIVRLINSSNRSNILDPP